MVKGEKKTYNSYTIIIPTFNRPECLKRLLNYYEDSGENCNVIVADSSSDENKKKNEKTITSLKKVNVLYLDKYSSDYDPLHKIADALTKVKKKYCVLCGDDDFITVNGINKSVNFLEGNNDFSCAQGVSVGFFIEKDDKENKKISWTISKQNQSVIFLDPSERLLFHFSNYNPTFYAVHRTDFMSIIFNEKIKFTDDNRFGELLPSMLALIHGKTKQLDVLYCIREITRDSGGRTTQRMQDFISEGTYNAKYERFKECLSNHLCQTSKINKKVANKIVDLGWKEYTKKHKGYKIPKINYMMKKMPIPSFINRNIRKTYRKINVKKNQKPKIVIEKSYEIPEKYLEECEIVKKYVMEDVKKDYKDR